MLDIRTYLVNSVIKNRSEDISVPCQNFKKLLLILITFSPCCNTFSLVAGTNYRNFLSGKTFLEIRFFFLNSLVHCMCTYICTYKTMHRIYTYIHRENIQITYMIGIKQKVKHIYSVTPTNPQPTTQENNCFLCIVPEFICECMCVSLENKL